MQTATPTFLVESLKTTEGARPVVEIEIETALGWVSYGNRVTSVSDVDRVLEKYGEQGIGFAGDVTFTLENTDGIFSPGTRDSGPFQGQVLGRQVAIYQLFYTKDPAIIPFMVTDKGMTTTVDMDEGCTEKLPAFVGKISRCITNDNRTVTITVRDIIQDLVESEMASNGLVSGNVADGLKTILEAAGFDVNVAAYEQLRRETAGSWVARAWSSGDKAIDLVQDLNKACGTNVVANADGEMVMLQLFPRWGEFARLFYLDRSQEPLYSGDEDDRENLNVMTADGTTDEVFLVNRVTFTYKNIATLQNTTVVYQDLSSILKYGVKNLDLTTGAYIPAGLAHVWPSRILERYSVEDATAYALRASLRHSVVVEVGDHIYLTEPSADEDQEFFLVTQASRNPFDMSAGVGVEAIRNTADEKWAFAGDATPGGSERDSALMDYIFNKSFEIPWDAPSNMLPWKWSSISGSGGSFESSTDQARTGQYSGKVVGSATTRTWEQILSFDLLQSTNYTLSVYVKGGPPAAGTFGVEVRAPFSTFGTLNIAGTYGSWTRLTLTFNTGLFLAGPVRIGMTLTGFTGTYYLDDLQIDKDASAKDFQENWLFYAYAGQALDQANPGFDSDGNANGVIDQGLYGGWEQLYLAF